MFSLGGPPWLLGVIFGGLNVIHCVQRSGNEKQTMTEISSAWFKTMHGLS